MTQEICRYCRTQVCEDCFVAATSRDSAPQSEAVHQQHACLSCSRLHPAAKKSRSPPRDRRLARFGRMHSAPISGAPLIDSLSKGMRDVTGWTRHSKSSTGFLSAEDKPEQQTTERVSRRGSTRTSQQPEDLEFPSVDLRRRRHTSAIAPTARSCDVTRPGRGLSARQLMRAHSTDFNMISRRQANATELHTSQRVGTSYLCDFTRTNPRMAIRDAASTGPKERSMMRNAARSQPLDLTGAKPSLDLSDGTNELELSTVDLRLPKYKVDLPAPVKHGRRASAADPVNSALTPISYDNLAALDSKLELMHLDTPDKESKENQPEQSSAPRSSSFGGSRKLSKHSHHRGEPIDFHLSTVDLRPRPRRHTTPETCQKVRGSRQGNQEPVATEGSVQERRGGFTHFHRQKKSEPIDFHLSKFGLMPRRHTTDSNPETNRTEVEHRKSRTISVKKAETVAPTPEATTPTNSKNKLCDLAYLENFRSYTV
ncbi:uncharacterized protein IUM83_03080 [Phytophthora cinnamomi]|uniref:uncharacterized protein n=1 Tax=Phytophthora cinnamomi TaxID=4785 RepID=UPI00355AC99E|nr:hypothetical protein IUM83_03080 [Phytophthora cinnamomi]